MATIRIPFADTQIDRPNPGAGQIRARRDPALRDPRAGQMPTGVGSINPNAGAVDVGLAGAQGRAEMQAAREAGQSAIQAGSALDRMAEAEGRLTDQTALTQAGVEAQRSTVALQEAFGTRSFATSEQARAEFREAATTITGKLGEGLSPRAQLLWEARSEEIILDREMNVAQAARTRIQQTAIGTVEEGIRTLANMAAQARNPVERATFMDQGEGAIRSLAEAGAINPLAATRMARGFRQDVQQADITRLMGTNPGAAIRMLNDTAATPDIDADRRASLRNQAEQRQETLAARARATAADQDRRVWLEIQNVNGLLSQGQVPEDRMTMLRAMARGTRYEPMLVRMEADAREIGTFRNLPVGEQAARLRAAEARMQGSTATDADLELVQRLGQVAQNQRQAYLENGVARGVVDRFIEPLSPLNLADPASLMERERAASRVSAARGEPVSMLSRSEVQSMQQQFTTGTVDQRLSMIRSITLGVSDPGIRGATLRHLERGRGDAGDMPAGTGLLVAELVNSGTLRGDQAARALMGSLAADVSDITRRAGEAGEMNEALISARGREVQGAVMRAASYLGPGAGSGLLAMLNRDEDLIRRHAARLVASGMSYSVAVRQAQGTVNTERGAINEDGLAHVFFRLPRATPAEMSAGLRLLREEAGRVDLDPAAGPDANMQARARRDAAASAVWVNEGANFALVARGEAGTPVVLRTATVDEVKGAARGRAERDAERPPVMRREDALERTRTEQRRRMPAPEIQ